MPLDYYELTYVMPLTSILMTGVCALVLGALLCLALRKATAVRRVPLVVPACIAASVVLSVGFAAGAISVSAAQLMAEAGLGAEAQQVSGIQEKAMAAALRAGDVGLRDMFAARLLVAVLIAFMVVVTSAYGQ